MKSWYDGFVFGKCRGIYNPWSILNYLDKRKFETYWANTSSNSLVDKLIREGSPDRKIIMEDLLKVSAVWSLLLASGYLRVENFVVNGTRGKTEYDLKITNKEVQIMFEQMIEDWFVESAQAYNSFIKVLLAGNIEAMNTYINKVAFDTGKKVSKETEPERFYHGFVLGLIVELIDRYIIASNRESGFGRYDVLLEPKTEKDDAIIFEFKVYNPDKEKDLQDTVKSALQQIEDKKYAASLEAKGIPAKKIRKYGFAFKGKEVLIG